ncbi:amidohydrolase [Chitinibacter bivalviorum]|uniref:Amidohydrolase n=1 Tax=Chitinibacter bivalviorum TaxID=2739434 RepID=A0A7H9BKW7_9NEIS|nr:amidohydrolase [Chitinibacter bivalviorum]QLG89032.1 amidohydrolase [Chitinibacter bivalviorum]
MISKPALTLLCSILLGTSWAQSTSLQDLGGQIASSGNVTTIYLAREFITMNPQQSKAQAIAVKDGKFIAVGSEADVRKLAGSDAKIDRSLVNKVVVAGFIEQHVHPVLAALTMNSKVISIEDWDAIDGFSPAVRNPVEYEARLKSALAEFKAKKNGPETPFISWGYHHYMHGDKMSRAYLDKLAPDFPVIIWHRSCHEFFLNTAALKLTGITEAQVARMPESAQKQLDYAKGHFFEQGAMAVLGNLTPFLATPEKFKQGLEFTEKYYHRNGITLAAEPGGFFSKPLQDLINSVYGDEATPFNHLFMADGKTFSARNPNDAAALIKDTEQVLDWGKGRTAYMPKQVKLLTDGAIYSQLMMMKDGYIDGHLGAWIMDPPVLDYAFQAYWDAGYQIHVHNNGDAGLDVLLDSLEKAVARNPRLDHRTVLVHFGFARPEQIKRWIELGGIVSSNPYYVTALAGPYSKMGIGAARAQFMVPNAEVLKNGGSLSFHSDMPMAPAKPLQLMWAGVNRLTYEGNVAAPAQKISVEAALKAITIDAAYSIQQEKKVGSIEVGKDANLTILEQSPFEVSPTQLKEIKVWGTMLEGRMQPVSQPAQVPSTAKGRIGIKPVAEASELNQALGSSLYSLLSHKHLH